MKYYQAFLTNLYFLYFQIYSKIILLVSNIYQNLLHFGILHNCKHFYNIFFFDCLICK